MIDFAHKRIQRGEQALPTFRERIQALRLVPRFLSMVWRTKPLYGVVIFAVRIVSAFGPLALLFVGKLLVDAVIANVGSPAPEWRLLLGLVGLELGIAFA